MKLFRLIKRLSGDHDFRDNTILGSMCTEPHSLAKKTYRRFLSTNIGDPGLFPNLKALEDEYIAGLGRLLSNNNVWGTVVSGGSEANILAMWAARTLSGNKREVIIPETYHFSFEKAALMLGLNLIKIPVDKKQRVDTDLVEKAITGNTMAIIGIAGTTGCGACDPIKELSDIAVKYKIYLHVDAAFGGFVYPFLDTPPRFDFSLPGVMSISLDPHKMGRAVIQSGCILYRDRSISKGIQVPVSYLSGGETTHATILGTRSGASIASAWMIYNYLGFKGYKNEINRLMDLTKWFTSEIKTINGLGLIIEPEINIVGITITDNISLDILVEKLRKKGWALSKWPNYFRITIMPHIKKNTLRKFLKDLKAILIIDIKNGDL